MYPLDGKNPVVFVVVFVVVFDGFPYVLFSPNMKHVERRLKIIAIPRLSDMVSVIKWARIGYKFAFSLPIKYTALKSTILASGDYYIDVDVNVYHEHWCWPAIHSVAFNFQFYFHFPFHLHLHISLMSKMMSKMTTMFSVYTVVAVAVERYATLIDFLNKVGLISEIYIIFFTKDLHGPNY